MYLNMHLSDPNTTEDLMLIRHIEIKLIFSSEISNDSFAMTLAYQINNMSMEENFSQRNETYKIIQDSQNKLVSL